VRRGRPDVNLQATRYAAERQFRLSLQQRHDLDAPVVGDALDDAFTAVGAAARDPAVHEDFKETGEALGKALSKTLNEVAAEVRKAFDRSPK